MNTTMYLQRQTNPQPQFGLGQKCPVDPEALNRMIGRDPTCHFVEVFSAIHAITSWFKIINVHDDLNDVSILLSQTREKIALAEQIGAEGLVSKLRDLEAACIVYDRSATADCVRKVGSCLNQVSHYMVALQVVAGVPHATTIQLDDSE